MMLQLHDVYDPDVIIVKMKIVSGSRCGVVAAEAKNRPILHASGCAFWTLQNLTH